MVVTVKLYATLRKFYPDLGVGEGMRVELPEGATVGQLLNHLNLPPDVVRVAFVNGIAGREPPPFRRRRDWPLPASGRGIKTARRARHLRGLCFSPHPCRLRRHPFLLLGVALTPPLLPSAVPFSSPGGPSPPCRLRWYPFPLLGGGPHPTPVAFGGIPSPLLAFGRERGGGRGEG